MIREKITQAARILDELNIDLWLIFVRESSTSKDPSVDLVVGTGYTWQSAFCIHRSGKTVAVLGSLDAAEVEKKAYYERIVPYVGGIRESLLKVLGELDPATIALNWSLDNCLADGLTHGMFLQLERLLAGTPWAGRFCSSEAVVAALRGRKTPEEIRRLKRAVDETEQLYRDLCEHLRPGLTERQIADRLTAMTRERGFEPAWSPDHCPSCFTGVPRAGEAHTGPSDRSVERGDVMNMDFGLRIDDYCSDLQRTWYVCREGEVTAPPAVEKGFRAVVDAIAEAAKAARPGVEGWVVDDVARSLIVSRGFPEYPHALGHQVGRSAHDGGVLFCPKWERYGQLPWQKIEEGQVFTLEPRVPIEGHGVATVEEMIIVTPEGGEFISSFQRDLWLVK